MIKILVSILFLVLLSTLVVSAMHTDKLISRDAKYSQYKVKDNKPPFQGKMKFCSDESKQTYYVTIKGDKVLITYDKVRIKGAFKKGLLFTDDPHEVEYRNMGNKKYNYGKFYVIAKSYFSVLNPENGEYDFYNQCK